MSNPLTHFNQQGRAKMVDVSDKSITEPKSSSIALSSTVSGLMSAWRLFQHEFVTAIVTAAAKALHAKNLATS